MHICIPANMHLCINVDMHICIYAYMYTHKHHLAHIISFCMDSPTHLDNTISMHMHKQIHAHIYNFITNDEIMNTQTRFWDQLSAPDPPKWATRAQEAPQRASMHFWKIYEKK